VFCIRYVGVEDSKLGFVLSVGMPRRRPPAPQDTFVSLPTVSTPAPWQCRRTVTPTDFATFRLFDNITENITLEEKRKIINYAIPE
jgi:hypothetical protein